MIEQPIQIGIAVVELDGRYLVGIRGSDRSLAGYAEFPGGKCKQGESSKQCAVRECLEETGLVVVPIRRLLDAIYYYPHALVDLHFWLCHPVSRPSDDKQSATFRWISADKLREQPFPGANKPVIEMLCHLPVGGQRQKE